MNKRPYSVGYFSSYDRGLECLLNMWPRIHKAVPKATLDIYYGWNSFDAVHRSNPQMMRWKWGMIRKLHDLKDMGVVEHGRVSHEELAKAMMGLQIWAYPTEFTEINCITALKAQEAGMWPVTTNVGALQETVGKGGTMIDSNDIYTNTKAQHEFVEKVILNMSNTLGGLPVPGVGWDEIAQEWDGALSNE